VSSISTIGTTLRAVAAHLEGAGERLPVIRGNRPGTVDPRIRKAVYRRDGYTCCWCHNHIATCLDPLEIDHIIPWSAGGTNATDNLRTLCALCNTQRSNNRSDSTIARALLIVGECSRCKNPDDPAVVQLEQAVWCVECRGPSTTTVAHADTVRRRQAELYAPFPEGGRRE
jgi:hypothetical protein